LELVVVHLLGCNCDVAKNVVASELEEDRAEVIRRRYFDKENLAVVTCNIMDCRLSSMMLFL
jgi:16S rRNA A1518/A1519 N6-dimethyltransferase RsmA/KsgA/DIM1 with predicted DNA glycosylase/AP lyase activity